MPYPVIIYKIGNSKDDFIFIASTKQKQLNIPMIDHRMQVKRKTHRLNGGENKIPHRLHNHMKNLGFHHFYIEELETVQVEDSEEKKNKTLEWVYKLKPVLNKLPEEQAKITKRKKKINHDKHIEKRRSYARKYYYDVGKQRREAGYPAIRKNTPVKVIRRNSKFRNMQIPPIVPENILKEIREKNAQQFDKVEVAGRIKMTPLIFPQPDLSSVISE